jgi:hypothetical protein
MRDELSEAKRRLAREIDSNSVLPSELIAADPWVQQPAKERGG